MKNLLMLLLSIPLIFSSCKKEDENIQPNNNGINNHSMIGYGYGDCFGEGVLCKTIDGGITWNFIGLDSLVDGYIDFPSENIGYSVGDLNGIHITNNGGLLWTHLYQNVEFGGVSFPSDEIGYCYDEDGNELYKTTDGGLTWNITNLNIGFDDDNMSFPTENIGYGGSDDKLYKSIDGGLSWSMINSNMVDDNINTGYDKLYICFPTVNIGYGYNRDNEIYKTINGGTTWELIYSSNSDLESNLSFTDENIGYISQSTSSGDGLLKTTDGGTTWNFISNSDDCLCDFICFL